MKNQDASNRAKSLAGQVSGRCSYIDSVFLRLPRLMEKRYFLELRRALVSQRREKGVRYVFKQVRVPDTDYFHLKLAVHQPSPQALQVLGEFLAHTKGPARVVEVHVALDLLVDTFLDAEQAKVAFLELFLPTSRPVAPWDWVADSTAYLNKNQKRGVGYAVYCDRKSKVTNTPCLHVECRIRGGQELEKNGLRFVSHLLELDHRKFWTKRLCLVIPPTAEKVDKTLAKMSAKRNAAGGLRSGSASSTGNAIARSSLGPREGVLAHDVYFNLLKSKLQFPRPRRMFGQVDSGWALPPRGNAIWDIDP